jgi:hypothetical protein
MLMIVRRAVRPLQKEATIGGSVFDESHHCLVTTLDTIVAAIIIVISTTNTTLPRGQGAMQIVIVMVAADGGGSKELDKRRAEANRQPKWHPRTIPLPGLRTPRRVVVAIHSILLPGTYTKLIDSIQGGPAPAAVRLAMQNAFLRERPVGL